MIIKDPPGSKMKLETLPDNPTQKRELAVDLFGRHIMWLRNMSLQATTTLIENAQEHLPSHALRRRVYEAAASLGAGKHAACVLCEETLDRFIQLLLPLLAHKGNDFVLGSRFAVRFSVAVEIVDQQTDETVFVEKVTDGGKRFLGDYWGQWLNRYGSQKAAAIEDPES